MFKLFNQLNLNHKEENFKPLKREILFVKFNN